MASDNYTAGAGAVCAATTADWARSPAARRGVDWLPDARTPVYVGGPQMNPLWWRFFREISARLDGISGKSLGEVNTAVSLVQTAVSEAQSAANSAQSTAAAASTAIDVIREVALNNGLDGADQIP